VQQTLLDQQALPVRDVLPALALALQAGNAVLVAPPGAGKTTLAPLYLLDGIPGRIVMLEPRRLAARAAATRMATLLGEPVGQTAGYRTRTDSAVSAATRIEVVTEGLLVRRLLSDPGLDGVGLVILDEIHERALAADLAHAGEEGQDVALMCLQCGPDRRRDRARQVARRGEVAFGLLDGDWEQPAGTLQHGRVHQGR
jgi:HrpA-like RNA helicase